MNAAAAPGKDLELMVAKAQSELDEKLKEIVNREAELAQREKEIGAKTSKKHLKKYNLWNRINSI